MFVARLIGIKGSAMSADLGRSAMNGRRARITGLGCVLMTVAAAIAVPTAAAADPLPPGWFSVTNPDLGVCPFPINVTQNFGPHKATPAKEFGITGTRITGASNAVVTRTDTGRSVVYNTGQPVFLTPTALYFSPTQHGMDAVGLPVSVYPLGAKVDFTTGQLTPFSPTRVVDPCKALGATLPAPSTTLGPWPLPADPLAGMARADLTPIDGALVEHFHTHLDVIINGHPVTLPAGLGQGAPFNDGTGEFFSGDGLYSSLHTHDTSGIIHSEVANGPLQHTLGQVFSEWNLRFTDQCIGGYCNAGTSALRVYVNGTRVVSNFDSIPLGDGGEIAVVYGPPGGSVPNTYDFPPGFVPGCYSVQACAGNG
jgi:hypothetical protein